MSQFGTKAMDLRPGQAIRYDNRRHYIYSVMPTPDGRIDLHIEQPGGKTKTLRVDLDMRFTVIR